jgi:hypothetical protein
MSKERAELWTPYRPPAFLRAELEIPDEERTRM